VRAKTITRSNCVIFVDVDYALVRDEARRRVIDPGNARRDVVVKLVFGIEDSPAALINRQSTRPEMQAHSLVMPVETPLGVIGETEPTLSTAV
jgi:hypothetical protein